MWQNINYLTGTSIDRIFDTPYPNEEYQYLQVEGAGIYFQVEGNGPYLVFVPGGDGQGVIFARLTSYLTKYFTVITYDRRGYGKSEFNGPQDFENRLDTEADDIYKLMRSLTSHKFTLFGTGAGGAVSLKYLAKYSETLAKMFVHEPMVNIGALSDSKELEKFHTDLCNVYKMEGQDAAVAMYLNKYLNGSDYRRVTSKRLGDKERSWGVHFEHETIAYSFYNTNTEIISANKDKLVLMYGTESLNSIIYRPVHAISKYLNSPLVSFPGGHIGYVTETEKFAVEFLKLCMRHSLINSIPKL
ncbi:hypothetical protein MFLAVUS_003270 [Mucor flavus]|uniref:AB hydrolase-1 domain-containing protein n=1 Tax=Mucor flavus TaxID=439312 RepID=A0ABP9YSP1_9FUNG